MFFILNISVSILNQLFCDEYGLLNQTFWEKKQNKVKTNPKTNAHFF